MQTQIESTAGARTQRTHHIIFGLRIFEMMDDKKLRECFGQDDGKTPTVKAIRAHLKKLRDSGLRFMPANGCDNYGPDGACLGHDKDVEFSNEIRSE